MRNHAAAPPPSHYPYDLNLADIAEGLAPWQRHRLVAPDLTAIALLDSPDLGKFAGRVSDSGEGRWTIAGQPSTNRFRPLCSVPALYERFSSRGEADFADQVLSALRYPVRRP